MEHGEPDVGHATYSRSMPRRPRKLRDAQTSRPAKPFLPDGSLDPREWKLACSAAGALRLSDLRDQPWFVSAHPIQVLDQGVELEVTVRWLSSEVWKEVPFQVDGYPVNVVLEGQDSEIHPIH